MKPKIQTNVDKTGEGKCQVDAKVAALRLELEQKRKKAGEEEILDIVEKAVDLDGRTYLEKYCRGQMYVSAHLSNEIKYQS